MAAFDEEAVFQVARQIDRPDTRRLYLDQVCGLDADLRARVDALLRAHDEEQSFLERPAVAPGATGPVAPRETVGTHIGPYKLLQQIGEGGMGTVYMAEQTHPVRRRVALKVIKPGMDSKQVVARFEAERQALTLMDHVNIARVFDGGTTGTGLPYFVMELFTGVPITKYCDDNHLTPRQRLELFVPVCQAIQHAHQKGIIHRDVKPSNVMVTLYDGRPVPKVIDFGVAKATEHKLTDQTLFTQHGGVIGTLEYMSPEQAEMSALGVDTRSDVYSLGALLYELLTGSTPLSHKRMKQMAFAEIIRLIKVEDPPWPSTRLSNSGEALALISAQRQMESGKLTRLVRGELDWIVMKCLEKDRGQRYETANGFAADLLRYLADETVQACPPSARYRFSKFARRNKRALATAAVLAVAVLVVAGTLGWAVRDREARAQQTARERADREVAIQAKVATALNEAERWREQEKWPEALSAVKRAEGLLAGAGSDVLNESVRLFLRDVDFALHLEEIRLLASETVDGSFDWKRQDQRYEEAFRAYGIDVAGLSADKAARIRVRPRVAVAMGVALDDWAGVRGNIDPAGREGLTALAQTVDPDPWRNRVREARGRKDGNALGELAAAPELSRQPPTSLSVLAGALRQAGLADAQVGTLRLAQRQHLGDFWVNYNLAIALSKLGPAHRDASVAFATAAVALRPQSAAAHNVLGIALKVQGKFGEAVASYERALTLDPKHVPAHCNLGGALMAQQKLEEANARFRAAIALDPNSAPAHTGLGWALCDQGKLDEAVESGRRAIALDSKSASAHYNLGRALALQKKLDEAISCYRQAIALDPTFAKAHMNLGNELGNQGKWAEAVACYETATQLNPKDAVPHISLGVALSKQDKLEEAVASLKRAISLDPNYATAHYNLGVALSKQDKLDEAVASLKRTIALDPNYATAHYNLGNAYSEQRKLDEAVTSYRRAIELNRNYTSAHLNLGNELIRQGKLVDAVTSFKRVIELDSNHARAHNQLGIALRRLKRWDEAVTAHRTAIKLDPKYARAYHELGVTLQAQGELGEAITSYKRAIELEPNNTERLADLAWLLATCGEVKHRDPAGAVELAQRAVDLSPDDDFHQAALGVAHYRVGNWKNAVAALSRGMELRPGEAGVTWFYLAMAHWKLGDKGGARKFYDQGVKWVEKSKLKNEPAVQAEAADLMSVKETQK
ncbi:serine/threonine-protein kinase [Singulisphaera acidiphila]|uniref:Serine/threonine protein kinase n=3 Tax=Singulisphaera acidiphila TaxID=466153 RepID=L0DHF5_SINAD|nr:serine/threonine-protein kinase [Singulisphaera acidiphila]AGA28248.1 serine/threonine protein kinase [Singulisphaera acidiphila DSM 18658]